MKEILKTFLTVFVILALTAGGIFGYFKYKEHKDEEIALEQKAEETQKPVETATPTPEPTQRPENMIEASLGVCGDIIMHTGINAEALQSDGTYNYSGLFGGAYDIANGGDYTICTLNTSLPNTGDYSAYPLYKSPTEILDALLGVGFDLVNTANSHSLDGGVDGLIATLDKIDLRGIEHVGTYRTLDEKNNNLAVVKDINGIKVAFISYTRGTNKISMTGYPFAVNTLTTDYDGNMQNIDYEKLEGDMEYVRGLGADMICVIAQWGTEYDIEPSPQQEELADFFLKEGADIILGGGLLVPQPLELRKVTADDGSERTCLIAYSLGSLISGMDEQYTNLSLGLRVVLQKNPDTGEASIKEVRYAPLYMVDLYDHNITDKTWRYQLWNLRGAINSYESGDDFGIMTEGMYQSLKAALVDINFLVGKEFDYENGGVNVDQWLFENRD